MAASGLKVRISADVSTFARDMNRATADVNRFSAQVNTMGSTLTRTGRAAASAASSLGSLGAVLPGLGSATGSLVGNLGKASIILGEATVLSAGLTKGWGLLSAAATRLGPAAATAVATIGPIGAAALLAAGGVALLASDFANLGRSISQAKSSFAGFSLPTGVISNGSVMGPGVRSVQSIDLSGRTMDSSQMTGRRAHMLEGVTTSTSASGNTAQMALVTHQVTQATREWQQALAGVRPMTDSVSAGWVSAMDAVNASLRNTVNLTRTEVAELFAMKGQLQDIFRVKLNVPDVIGPPGDFAKGAIDRILNPAHLADDLLGATGRTGVPTPGVQPKKAGDKSGAVLQGLLAFGLGQFTSNNAGSSIGGLLGAPFGAIGSAVGSFLGGKLGDLFGGSKRRREEERAASALAKFSKELERVTQTTISYIPTGFKIARFIDGAADPVTSVPTGTMRRGMYVFQIGTLSIRADNPDDFAEQMSRAAEKQVRRGGVSGFQLAVAQTARGY